MIDKIIPFYTKATISNRTLEKFNLSDKRFIKITPKAKMSKQEVTFLWDSLKNTQIELIHILPNDIYFCSNTNPEEIIQLLSFNYNNKKINALIHNVDYTPIARNIEIISEGKKAAYNLGNGNYEIAEIYTDKFIKDALNETVTTVTDEIHKLTEKFTDDAFDSDNFDNDNFASSSSSSIEIKNGHAIDLEHHLRSNSSGMVPILLGLSGVAKSTLVKKVVNKLDEEYRSGEYKASYEVDNEDTVYGDTVITINKLMDDGSTEPEVHKLSYEESRKYGMRLVDIRCGLMQHLDIDGLFAKEGHLVGDTVSYSALPFNFVQCTDSYILFARKMLNELEAKRKSPKVKGDLLEQLDKAIEHFREAAKIPVLFFDEINRSYPEVRNTLVTILSSHTFSNMSMKLCKIVAAANMPVGNMKIPPEELQGTGKNVFADGSNYQTDLERLSDQVMEFFTGTEKVDSNAFSSRFEMFNISPEEIYPSWREWGGEISAEGKQNIHPSVLDYVTNSEIAYDVDFIYDYCTSDEYMKDKDLGYVPPYPTYRAWQLVSDYLYHLDKTNGLVNDDIIFGYLGKSAGTAFIEQLDERFTKPSKIISRDTKPVKLADNILKQRRELLLRSLLSGMSPLIEKENLDDFVSVSRINDDILNATDNTKSLGSISKDLEIAQQRINKINDLLESGDSLVKYKSSPSDPVFDKYIELISGMLTQDFSQITDVYGYFVSVLDNIQSKNTNSDEDLSYIVRQLLNTAVNNPQAFNFNKRKIESGEIKPVRDDLTRFVNEGLEAGVPVALIGISGIGKSTRVENFCKEHGDQYIYHMITLSGKEPSDILGVPVKVSLVNQVSKTSDKVFSDLGLSEEKIQSYIREFGLRNEVTVKAPNDNLHRVIKTAVDNDKTVVLFFDEANRCADKLVQSALFEGISDNRLFGVNFNPENVRIVIAGNTLADSSRSGQLQSFDPALLARCSVQVMDKYTQADVQAVWDYMSDETKDYNGYHPLLIKWFESLGVLRNEVLRQCLESVETSSLCNNCSSTRALKSLTNALSGRYMSGTILYPNGVEEFSTSGSEPKTVVNKVSDILKNINDWSAVNGKFELTLVSKGVKSTSYDNLEKVIERLKKLYKMLKDSKVHEDGIAKGYTTLEFLQKLYDSGWNSSKFVTRRNEEEMKEFEDFESFYRRIINNLNYIRAVDKAIVDQRQRTISKVIGQGGNIEGYDEKVVRFDIIKAFSTYYNVNSGKSSAKALTRRDIVDVETARQYMQQWFDRVKDDLRTQWSVEIEEIRKERMDAIDSIVYLNAISQAVEINTTIRKGNIASNIEQMIALADGSLKSVVIDLESDIDKEAELLRFLTDQFDVPKNKYNKYKQVKDIASSINAYYIDDINRAV